MNKVKLILVKVKHFRRYESGLTLFFEKRVQKREIFLKKCTKKIKKGTKGYVCPLEITFLKICLKIDF